MNPDTRRELVLFVCTANVCRSPLGASAFANAWGAAGVGDVRVESAGVDADIGSPQCPVSVDVAVGASRADSPHRARQLDADDLSAAAIVLALDRTQSAFAARLLPQCRARLFTLVQAANLAERVVGEFDTGPLPPDVPPRSSGLAAQLSWLVMQMDASRWMLAGIPADELDLPDTHGAADHAQPLRDVRETAIRLAESMARGLHVIGERG